MGRLAVLQEILLHGNDRDDESDAVHESVRDLVARLAEDRAIVDCSEHVLAVCRA
jgi:hypothetical protein